MHDELTLIKSILSEIESNGGKFTVWQEGAEVLSKAFDGSKLPKGSPGWLQGYCSTQRRDRQDEQVMQAGLNFDPFMQYGFFNDNHSPSTVNQAGIPLLAEHHPGKGWWTEGYLLPNKIGMGIADLAKSLKEVNAPRQLGFSVEGKIRDRDKFHKIVRSADVRQVAITHCPVNPECTWELLSKALSAGGTVAGGVNGRSIITEEDLEHDVKTTYGCAIGKCRGRFKTKDALATHQKRVHGRTSTKSNKVVLSKAVNDLSYAEAEAFIRTARPNWDDDLVHDVLSRARS